jgi:hypothetical protein
MKNFRLYLLMFPFNLIGAIVFMLLVVILGICEIVLYGALFSFIKNKPIFPIGKKLYFIFDYFVDKLVYKK